ncbi:MAG: RNA 2',3'-cyclic phosphodiesterase [Pseudomonadota bacterium]
MHRLFVALDLPEVVADALSVLQSGVDGARWRTPEQFHLTLAFIGDVDRHGHDDVGAALDGLSAPGFSLTLSGAGYFGDHRPRALWAGLDAEPALKHLHDKIVAALRRFDVAVDARKFTPHVTLAYLAGVSQDAAERYCAGHGLFRCGPFPVRAFNLYESYLGGEASHYEILESYPLTAA